MARSWSGPSTSAARPDPEGQSKWQMPSPSRAATPWPSPTMARSTRPEARQVLALREGIQADLGRTGSAEPPADGTIATGETTGSSSGTSSCRCVEPENRHFPVGRPPEVVLHGGQTDPSKPGTCRLSRGPAAPGCWSQPHRCTELKPPRPRSSRRWGTRAINAWSPSQDMAPQDPPRWP